MKRAMILLFFAIGLTSWSTAQSTIKGNEYRLKGEIINSFYMPPACGTIAAATVIEFKIQTFTDTNYKDKEIAIIFPCPDIYGSDFFKVGSTYEVQIADQDQANFGWAIWNKDLLKKYTIGYDPYVINAKRLDVTNK